MNPATAWSLRVLTMLTLLCCLIGRILYGTKEWKILGESLMIAGGLVIGSVGLIIIVALVVVLIWTLFPVECDEEESYEEDFGTRY